MIAVLLLTIENQDDRDFIEDLYLSYEGLLYAEIFKVMKNHTITEDLLQNVIIKLILNVELLRTLDRPRLVAYIVKTARFTAYKHIRDEKRKTGLSLIDDLDSLEETEGGLDPQILSFELNEAFKSAWNALDERSRWVLEMKCFLEYTNEEIAAELGVAPATVRSLISRSRSRLKALLF